MPFKNSHNLINRSLNRLKVSKFLNSTSTSMCIRKCNKNFNKFSKIELAYVLMLITQKFEVSQSQLRFSLQHISKYY